MNVEFKFEIDQKVKTIFGDMGVINMAGIDDAKENKYFVQWSSDSQWMKESQLSEISS